MKKLIACICFLVGMTGTGSLHAIGLRGGINWDMSTLVGKYAKFTDQYSLRGGSAWIDFEVSRKFSLGIDIGYHQLFENKTRATYYPENGQAFTASTYNHVYDIPLMATLRYTLIAKGILRPYVSIGIGGTFTRQDIVFSDMVLREKTWGFGLAPAVGTYIVLGDRVPVGLNVFARYGVSFNDYSYKNEKLSPYQYLNIGVGIVFQ